MLSSPLTDFLPTASTGSATSPPVRTPAPASSQAASDVPAQATQDVAATQAGTAEAKVDRAALKKSVDTINGFLQPHAANIEFSIDDQSGKTLLKIVDSETNTVLMQIPSKEALALSQTIGQTKGFLIKDRA